MKTMTTPRLVEFLRQALGRSAEIVTINRAAVASCLDVIDSQQREIERLRGIIDRQKDGRVIREHHDQSGNE